MLNMITYKLYRKLTNTDNRNTRVASVLLKFVYNCLHYRTEYVLESVESA
jgi:hypothetical protein